MQTVADRPEAPTAIRTDLGAIFVSLELSRSTWLITSLSPGGGEKMSKQVVRGGDVAGLLERFARLREKARARTGKVFPFVVIQEAGLDGFWIDRALHNEGIESHVVDPASIATSRRRRRAKTDGIDGEALVRALLAYKRGEPRVCAMVKAPTPEEEDRRRLCRERKVLIVERVRHVNREPDRFAKRRRKRTISPRSASSSPTSRDSRRRRPRHDDSAPQHIRADAAARAGRRRHSRAARRSQEPPTPSPTALHHREREGATDEAPQEDNGRARTIGRTCSSATGRLPVRP